MDFDPEKAGREFGLQMTLRLIFGALERLDPALSPEACRSTLMSCFDNVPSLPEDIVKHAREFIYETLPQAPEDQQQDLRE